MRSRFLLPRATSTRFAPACANLRAVAAPTPSEPPVITEIGRVAPGARADLLVYDGNPVHDPAVLQDPDRHLRLIVKDGAIFKNTL